MPIKLISVIQPWKNIDFIIKTCFFVLQRQTTNFKGCIWKSKLGLWGIDEPKYLVGAALLEICLHAWIHVLFYIIAHITMPTSVEDKLLSSFSLGDLKKTDMHDCLSQNRKKIISGTFGTIIKSCLFIWRKNVKRHDCFFLGAFLGRLKYAYVFLDLLIEICKVNFELKHINT